MGTQIRYFIIPVMHTTSACMEGKMMNHCRVVNEDYREIFNLLLDEEDTESFKEIMSSDKSALLYRKHEFLGEVAYWRIDNLHKEMIYNGLDYP